MDVENFEYLLARVRPYIEKKDTHMRQSISARDRLAVTLRFLATGEAYKSMRFGTRIHNWTISKIVMETSAAIYECLKDEFLKVLSTTNEWEAIAQQFELKLNFPNCFSAMDGKHIEFSAAKSDGSEFHNYYGTNSIVLLALVDANYKFLVVDVGVNGRVSDGGAFRDSDLHKALDTGVLNIPPPKCLPNRDQPVPYVMVADDAFPLRPYLMKPFPQRNLTVEERIYNYRLSRARRIVENAFGIFSNRFRVFLTTIKLSPDKIKQLVLTACVLHNFLIQKTDHHYLTASSVDRETAAGIEPGSWRLGPHFRQGMQAQAGNRPTVEALQIRQEFKHYFNNEGSVPWQADRI